MTVCTILGHITAYDWLMWENLDSAVRRVLCLSDEVEFLLHGDKESDLFNWACISLGAFKELRPHKHITITMVAPKHRQKALERDLVHRQHRVDRVVVPELPASAGRMNRITYEMRMARWCIENSTHLISYIYLPFATRLNYLYWYAKKREINIIDITDPETQSRILEDIARLPQRQQRILQSLQEGMPLEEIASQHGIGTYRLMQIIQREHRRLTDATIRRVASRCPHSSLFGSDIVL